MSKIILKALVGSRAHGLHNDKSDFDWRGVFIEPAIKHLTPFSKVKNTSWIEGDLDDTSYEAINFIKTAAQCNPNILEVLYAPKFDICTEEGAFLISNRQKFLDAQRIFDAHRGYAMNQYKKMNLFEPDERTPKFVVAYLRALHNGIELLHTGQLNINITDEKFRRNLLAVKYNFNSDAREWAMAEMESLQKGLVDTMAVTKVGKADIPFWEDTIKKFYL